MALAPTLELSVQNMIDELSKDKTEGSYYHSWQANIAMAFKDAFDNFMKTYGRNEAVDHVHMIANAAARNFLDQLTHKPDNG